MRDKNSSKIDSSRRLTQLSICSLTYLYSYSIIVYNLKFLASALLVRYFNHSTSAIQLYSNLRNPYSRSLLSSLVAYHTVKPGVLIKMGGNYCLIIEFY